MKITLFLEGKLHPAKTASSVIVIWFYFPSRDTLVQVWCAKTGSSLNNLRGHTNTVTCASLLTAEQSRNLSASLSGTTSEEAGPRLALTGSSDCCLKLWNIDSGTALCSIYTFSGVTALCYLPDQQYCVIGSEGGKLEVYTFLEENTNPLFSIKTFDSSVSSIKVFISCYCLSEWWFNCQYYWSASGRKFDLLIPRRIHQCMDT